MNDIRANHTVETARRALTILLANESIDSPELDARMLAGAVLDLDLTGLIAAAARRLTEREAAQLNEFSARRIAGEPVARIIGAKEFWGLPLALSQDTLVPRPDTETVVEAALDAIDASSARNLHLRIADLGTGSGAILLALLSELPRATGVGTDVSVGALRVARDNAHRLGLADRATLVACDYAAALSGPFDLIVSNPPYIRAAEIAMLAPEVCDHDPHRALDGGHDGLDAYRRLVPQATALLADDGAVVVEIGRGQSSDVGALMVAAGLAITFARTDWGGIPRAIAGRKLLR